MGNSDFIQPIVDIYSKNIENESISVNELIQRIDFKRKISKRLKPEKISFDEEINHISKNFYSLSTEESFIDWCKDITNITFLEKILSNQNLVIDTEDSLLQFILNLCHENQLFNQLFSYICIEYCSLDCVNSFLQYVNNYFYSIKLCNSDYAIIECLSKRCKYNLKDVPSKDSKRYNKIKYNILKTYNYQENDVRNGILFNENKKQNVIITPSSIYDKQETHNPIHLLEMSTDTSFFSQDFENSSITFSLRDKTPFNINKYMIRGNWCDNELQMISWKLEGQLASNNDWVPPDLKNYQRNFTKFEVRVFSIPQSEPLISVKLTQTSPNYNNNNILGISSFEIFGDIFSSS